MTNYIYNIFGSMDSIDYDIAIKVDKLSTVEENKQLIFDVENILKQEYSDKPLNCNLVVVNNNIITQSHKGTPDEVNNSVLRTYSLHPQKYPCFTNLMVKRDVDLKILRAYRTILSFCSRTEHRDDIKHALKGKFAEQYAVFNDLDFLEIYESGLGNTKNITLEHFYKKSAFQIVQVLGLIMDKFEYYTKQEIIDSYLTLKPIMYYDKLNIEDIGYLENLKNFMHTSIKHYHLYRIIHKKESDFYNL